MAAPLGCGHRCSWTPTHSPAGWGSSQSFLVDLWCANALRPGVKRGEAILLHPGEKSEDRENWGKGELDELFSTFLLYWVGQKIHLGFSIKLLPENPNKHCGQPNIYWDRILLISIKDLESLKEQRGGPVRYFVLFKARKAWVSILSCCVKWEESTEMLLEISRRPLWPVKQ